MFRNYFITTFRNLVRNKVNTIINVTGLTISIACCIVIYVFVKHEKSFDSHHVKADRIYRVVSDERTSTGVSKQGYVNFAIANALRNDFPQLETVTQVLTNNQSIVSIDEPSGNRKVFEEKEMTFADPYFLKTFDYKVLAGQKIDLLTKPGEVILTQELADKFFAETKFETIIGRAITINKRSYKVAAIIEDVPRNSNITFKMLLPFSEFIKDNQRLIENWQDTYSESFAFVTLPPNYSQKQLEAALIPFKNKYLDKEVAARVDYHIQPLAKVHTDEAYGGTSYATPSVLILAFVCMGIIVLATACINFINLATAQSAKRAKEVGIRKTLGSNKWQLKLQFMAETFTLVLLAAIVGTLIANQFLKAFNDYVSFIVNLDLHIDLSIILFLAVLVIAITLIAGYYPAQKMAGYNTIKALKFNLSEPNNGNSKVFSLRKALVATQFVVSQLLIIGTIVVASQMRYFHNTNLGFKKEGIMTVEVAENDPAKLQLIKTQLKNNAKVIDVTYNSGPPTSAANGFSEIRRKDAPPTEKIMAERKFVDASYIPVFEIKLLTGRNLIEADKTTLSDSTVNYNVVVNKKTISQLGYANPIEALGKPILINGKEEATIVGVTDNFYNVSLQQEVTPCVLFYGTNWISTAAIKVTDANSSNLLPFIEQQWKNVFPENVFKAMPLTDYFKYKAFYVLEDLMYQGFKIFVVLSLIIGCLGLYGLVSFISIQREKEIGIRKVLGASVKGIVYLFSKEFVLLVLLAFLVAAPLGYLSMKTWLETFANRIELTPLYFAIALIVSLLVASLTVGFQAVKAAIANPIKSLKSE